ncbi:MAG: hypothetical protein HZB39_12825 [Planctomycetes bacterium]|nr:hypothetical protein [Planctomycetota bacterium]
MKTFALAVTLAALCGCAAPPAPQTPAAVNQNCVMQVDHEVDPDVTTNWRGTTLAFCCNKCKTKFDALDDAGRKAAVDKAGIAVK